MSDNDNFRGTASSREEEVVMEAPVVVRIIRLAEATTLAPVGPEHRRKVKADEQ